jgi:hypothetical protein
MRDDHPGNIHPDDDMAHNVLRAQQRDAAPSAEEVAADHARAKQAASCAVCGASDTEVERVVQHTASCPAMQTAPGDPTEWVCVDDHGTPRERWLAKKKDRLADAEAGAVLALYRCGVGTIETPDHPDEDIPYHHPTATIPAEHRCGAYLDEVVYRGEVLAERDDDGDDR